MTFCGYSVPHPSEKKISLRIQTNGASALDVLRKGLEDLQLMCDHMTEIFQKRVDDFKSAFPEGTRTGGIAGEDT